MVKMKNLIKVICLLTAIVMLTACSGQSSKTTTNQTTAQVQTKAPDAKPADTKTLEPLNLKGMANMYGTPPARDSEFWKTMEKEFNISYEIDWVPADTYQQKLDLVLASGDLPEVMQIQNLSAPSVQKAIAAGAFWDLTPVLGDFSKYPNFKKYTKPEVWNYSQVKGKNYIFPRTVGNLNMALFIREDWLQKVNMKVPTTMDEFAEVMKAIAKSDVDGKGKADKIAFIPNAGVFASAFGTRDPVRDSDGGITYANLTENYGDYVDYMRGLYAAGCIPKEFALIKGPQQEEMFLSGVSATYMKNSWHKFRCETELQKVTSTAKIKLIPYLKGPKGYACNWEAGYFGGMGVSKKVDEKKMLRIADFFNATTDQKNYNLVNFGVEGTYWTMKDGAPSLTEKGKKEVNASFNAPFIYSMNEFAKVDSPLAPMSYNLKVREDMKALYKVEATKLNPFIIIQSDTWTTAWSKVSDEFASMEAKAISGTIPMSDFRSYQKKLADSADFKKAAKEFAQSYEGYFGKK